MRRKRKFFRKLLSSSCFFFKWSLSCCWSLGLYNSIVHTQKFHFTPFLVLSCRRGKSHQQGHHDCTNADLSEMWNDRLSYFSTLHVFSSYRVTQHDFSDLKEFLFQSRVSQFFTHFENMYLFELYFLVGWVNLDTFHPSKLVGSPCLSAFVLRSFYLNFQLWRLLFK